MRILLLVFIGLPSACAELCPKFGHLDCVLGFRLAADISPGGRPYYPSITGILQQNFSAFRIEQEIFAACGTARVRATYRLHSTARLPKLNCVTKSFGLRNYFQGGHLRNLRSVLAISLLLAQFTGVAPNNLVRAAQPKSAPAPQTKDSANEITQDKGYR